MHLQNNDLLQAIIEQPDDDQLRLVYADWLEEHGETARAEFIRVQIEMHPMRGDHPRWKKLCQRSQTLLEVHRDGWLKGFPAWVKIETNQGGSISDGCNFARGFVGEVCSLVDNIARDIELLTRLTPLTQVTLTGDDDSCLPTLLKSPSLTRIKRLQWWGDESGPLNRSSQVARWLAQATPLPGLEHLDIFWVCIGEEGAPLLANSPFLGSLVDLNVSRASLGDFGARSLAAASHLAQLKSLRLWGNEIGNAGLAGLAAATGLPGLKSLDLSMNEIGDAGVQALAESPFLNQLHSLDLWLNQIGDAGVAALARSPFTAKLRSLDLSDNPLTDVGARTLAESPYLDHLEYLSVKDVSYSIAVKFSRSVRDALLQRFGSRVHL